MVHNSSWTIVHVSSQPLGPSAAGLEPSASPERATGRGACCLNFCNAASSFFLSPHSSNIQGQILFCGLEKSEQTVGVCGRSFSPVLGAGAVGKGERSPRLCPGITAAHPHWWYPARERSQGADFGIGAPLRMCRGQWLIKQ